MGKHKYIANSEHYSRTAHLFCKQWFLKMIFQNNKHKLELHLRRLMPLSSLCSKQSAEVKL